MYDANDEDAKIENSVIIGSANCCLSEIIGSLGQQIVLTLRVENDKNSRGNIILRTEEITQNNNRANMHFSVRDLVTKSFNFKPFFYISRVMENGSYQRVYMSEYTTQKYII